jgi:poly(hydroxyalkanoate) depolymerase family esterase
MAIAVTAVLMLALPAASQASPAPGTVSSLSYTSGGNVFPYLVYTPKGYQPGQRLPLLVMAHGCETTAYQQMEANLYNPLADRKHFVVAYPDVDKVETEQQGPTRNCWQYPSPLDWQRGEGDDAAVAGITHSIMKAWNIEPQRVYLMGMSAGAFLTADMAATYSDLYAAVGENAGADYEDWECTLQSSAALPVTKTAQDAYTEMGPRARVVPKIVIGGDADQGIPPACADQALQQSLRTNNLVIDHQQTKPISLTPELVQHRQKPGGYSYTISTYLDQHGCVVGQRYLVHGMNHFWSGGSSNPEWKSWTDPKGPSAAVASWDFFSRYTLANTSRPCSPGTERRPSSRCPSATGRLHGRSLGPLRLGMRRAAARRAFGRRPNRTRRHTDFFCLSQGGIRAGYATPKLLARQKRSQRHKWSGRTVLILTANRHYRLRGVAPQSSRAAAATNHLLRHGAPIRLGRNRWYLIANGAATDIVEVRSKRVQQIGLAARQFTRTRRAAARLLRALG